MVSLALLCLLLVAGCRAQLNIPVSPCPAIFEYVLGSHGNWQGLLKIQSPPGVNRLQVKLQLLLEARTEYLGRLEMAEDNSVVTRRIAAGEPVKYNVHFPLSFPLPHVTRITVNDREVCEGPPVISRGYVTMITLHYTFDSPIKSGSMSHHPLELSHSNLGNQNEFVFKLENPLTNTDFSPYQQQPSPPRTQRPQSNRFLQLGNPSPNMDHESTSFDIISVPELDSQPQQIPPSPTQTPQPTNPPPHATTINNEPQHPDTHQSTAGICGQIINVNELIFNGKQTKRGEWPWIAAIFSSTNVGQNFRCSGVLINKRHVITAGHCIRSRGEPEIKARQLLVYLGKYQLLYFAESGTQLKEVKRIFVHPDYENARRYHADLAVLQLSESVEITRYVLPICLWNQAPDLEPVVGKLGTVVGWGRDEKGNIVTNEPHMSKIPIVSQEECILSDPQFYALISNRTFCGGFRNETGPCSGDSGSGLMIPFSKQSRNQWYLRGVVSVSLAKEELICDLSNYVVFTDVAKFQTWLNQFEDSEDLK